jgi:hypothetical protein
LASVRYFHSKHHQVIVRSRDKLFSLFVLSSFKCTSRPQSWENINTSAWCPIAHYRLVYSFAIIAPYLANLSISGIGLETCILFAKEGANVLMADISAPALEKASAKLKQLVPSAHKVEIQVIILGLNIMYWTWHNEGLRCL